MAITWTLRNRERIRNDANGRVDVESFYVNGATHRNQVLFHPLCPVFGQLREGENPPQICSGVDVDRIEQGVNQWEVDIEWRTPASDGGGEEGGEGSSLVVQVGRSIEFIREWRIDHPDSPLNYPAAPYSSPSPDVDVGGSAIDTKGEPVDGKTLVHLISIRKKVSIASSSLPEALIAGMQSTRNKKKWRVYAPGVVVFLGATTREVNGIIEDITFEFAADKHKHLRQTARTNGAGDVTLVTTAELKQQFFGVGLGQASHVYWHQPFPFVSDFKALGVGS